LINVLHKRKLIFENCRIIFDADEIMQKLPLLVSRPFIAFENFETNHLVELFINPNCTGIQKTGHLNQRQEPSLDIMSIATCDLGTVRI
jgi:hypothetical protein